MPSPQDIVAAQELAQKIKARLQIARKSEECELIGLPIEKLPLELFSMSELLLLWVNNNKLTVLDPGIGNLQKIQVLKINNNKLTQLPDEIGLCTSLVRLWAHNNRLQTLPRTIGLLEKVEHMSLEKNNITEMPWEFGRLTSVTALSYDEDKLPSQEHHDFVAAVHGLEDVERWKAYMKHLRRMDIAHLYKRLHMPREVLLLPLHDYPCRMMNLVDLRKVVLAGHELMELPLNIIEHFSLLTYLDLSRNNISVVHPEMGNLTMLRTLDLAENPIEILPLDLGYATNLTSFGLDFERIKVPAPEIAELGSDGVISWLKSLCAMRLSGDGELNAREMRHLPVEVCFVTTLTRLDIANNDIKYLHPEMSALVHLQLLHTNNNQITHLPEAIWYLSNVTDLNLDNNQIVSIPDELGGMTSIKYFSARNNKLKWLPSTIGNLTEVITFYGNHNALESLPYSFGDMVRIQDLRLHSNLLSSLPASLAQMQQVTQITMYDNKFELFPAPVCHMSRVKHAGFANNEIKLIPFEVGNMSSLSSLDLADNKGLEELPLYLGDITQLRILTIDCGALKIPSWEIVSKGIPCVMEHLRTLSRALVEHRLDLSYYGLHKLPLEVRDLPGTLLPTIPAR